jgi:hypothetical protein
VLHRKLIVQLSLFGLAMGILTVFVIPSSFEPVCWLFIFVICAYIIAKRATGRYFQHGFMVSVVNSLWIIAAHALLFNQYVAGHPQEARLMTIMPLSTHPRVLMIVMGLLAGALSGLVLGFFAFVAGKLVIKPAAE